MLWLVGESIDSQALCQSELANRVFLNEMNDCVFVFELLGKEFMRMPTLSQLNL